MIKAGIYKTKLVYQKISDEFVSICGLCEKVLKEDEFFKSEFRSGMAYIRTCKACNDSPIIIEVE